MLASHDKRHPKIAVLGMGNLLLKDEGIGVHVIRSLQTIPDLGPVMLVDGGTSPEAIDLIHDIDHLIIVDALRCGGEPGAVYRLSPEQIQTHKPSTIHEISVMHMLWDLQILGMTPEVTIIGIEPKEIESGLDLSPELAHRLPLITEVVLGEIRRCLGSKRSDPNLQASVPAAPKVFQ